MKYLLLTGATGLVGRYLLRDLMAADVPVAVVARSNRVESAVQRVEALMERWEQLSGRSLPRPVVLEADLRQPNLALDERSQHWIADNCDRILHNAASMTFREDKYGEPFLTNREGMQYVLDVCRQAGIRQFHHVSTAYVCGLRGGVVREDELDLGQENGNVYEVSKLAAEKMVRGADFLDRVTIYRPASVVGDTETGYTTSSHGFYLPLQLAAIIADRIPTELMGERFFRLLGLRGDEGKNLIPVDWLSAAIVELVNRPETHGKTYHMTNPRPVTVRLIQKVVQEAIEKHAKRRFTGTLSEEQIVQYEAEFQHHMEVYRSHWRDDPKFDRTNTDQALPHLPCPEIDEAMLLRIAAYPVKENFLLRRVEPPKPGFHANEHLQRLLSDGGLSAAAGGQPDSIGLQVNGSCGGQWRLLIRDGQLVGLDLGLGSTDRARCYLNSNTYTSLVEGRFSVEQSVRSGRVLIEGDLNGNGGHQDVVKILQSVVSAS
jgi:thioester reductase-like protein